MKTFFENFSVWKRFTHNGQFYVKISEGAAVNIRTGVVQTFGLDDYCRPVIGKIYVQGSPPR